MYVYVSGKVGKYAKRALINLQSCNVRFAYAKLASAYAKLASLRKPARKVDNARTM